MYILYHIYHIVQKIILKNQIIFPDETYEKIKENMKRRIKRFNNIIKNAHIKKFSNNLNDLFINANFILKYFDEIRPCISYNKDILQHIKKLNRDLTEDEREIYDSYIVSSQSVITFVYELLKNNQNNLAELIIEYIFNTHLREHNNEFISEILKIATLDIYSKYFQDVMQLFIKEMQKIKIKYMKYKNKYYKLKSRITTL